HVLTTKVAAVLSSNTEPPQLAARGPNAFATCISTVRHSRPVVDPTERMAVRGRANGPGPSQSDDIQAPPTATKNPIDPPPAPHPRRGEGARGGRHRPRTGGDPGAARAPHARGPAVHLRPAECGGGGRFRLRRGRDPPGRQDDSEAPSAWCDRFRAARP